MSLKFERDKEVITNIYDIAKELNGEMIFKLTEYNDKHAAVHETRKAIKKIRALLRLIRFEAGEICYAQENILYRDVGRLMSDLRDATALLETIDKLIESTENKQLVEQLKLVKQTLDDRRKSFAKENPSPKEIIEKAVIEFKRAAKRITTWPLESTNFNDWAYGLAKTYKQGNKAFHKAFETNDAHDFHEWRKAVKYLWNQILFLEDTWPLMQQNFANELSNLSSFLGDEHDLFVLKESFDSNYIEMKMPEVLQSFLDKKTMYLREEAYWLGLKIYAESKSSFFQKNMAYWSAFKGIKQIKTA